MSPSKAGRCVARAKTGETVYQNKQSLNSHREPKERQLWQIVGKENFGKDIIKCNYRTSNAFSSLWWLLTLEKCTIILEHDKLSLSIQPAAAK